MNAYTSRRRFVAIFTAALGTLGLGRQTFANETDSTETTPGGIGWPVDVFEQKYGVGTEADEMKVYPNPYLPNSELSVYFENGVATFIDISIPDGSGEQVSEETLFVNFLPDGSVRRGLWRVNQIEGTPSWGFQEFDAQSMNMAGSGATLIQTTTASNDAGMVRATISLAQPDAGSGFAPAEGSVGVGDSIDDWIAVHGEGHDGHAAMGSYDGTWNIDPWSTIRVFFQRASESDTVITQVGAVSNQGVNQDNAIVFANAILPQAAQLQAGYSAYAVANRPQGWGMSTWTLSETERVLLFVLGTGDGSGNILQVATSLYVSQ